MEVYREEVERESVFLTAPAALLCCVAALQDRAPEQHLVTIRGAEALRGPTHTPASNATHQGARTQHTCSALRNN